MTLVKENVSKWTIYGLIDPRIEDEMMKVRYVGKTNKNPPQLRLRGHLTETIRGDTRIGKWLRKMVAEQIIIEFIVLESGCGGWKEAEMYWIDFYPNLTNLSAGGDGVIFDGKRGDEIKEKMSRSWNKPGRREECAKRMRNVANERWLQPEFRKNIALKQKEFWKNPENAKKTKETFSKAQYKRYEDLATLEKQSIHCRKIACDPGVQQKLRESTNFHWQKIRDAGCVNFKQYREIKDAGCCTLKEYEEIKDAGCETLAEYTEVVEAGCETSTEYKEFLESLHQ